jgi:hypothetical protein
MMKNDTRKMIMDAEENLKAKLCEPTRSRGPSITIFSGRPAGMIITEATVSREGLRFSHDHGLWTPDQIAGWRVVVGKVRAAGGRIVAQLWHFGWLARLSFLRGAQSVSASATTAPGHGFTYGGKKPHEPAWPLRLDEIPRCWPTTVKPPKTLSLPAPMVSRSTPPTAISSINSCATISFGRAFITNPYRVVKPKLRTQRRLMKQAQLISIVVYAIIAWWYVAPYLKRLQLGQALTLLLWIHVFRYSVLYLYVAQHEGYAISDIAAAQLVTGDLVGAVLATVAIVALRFRSRIGLAISWVVIAATIGDAATAIYQRSIEPPRVDAAGVWWVIFVFYAPAIFVSLPLMGWQLVARRAEPLRGAVAPQPGA